MGKAWGLFFLAIVSQAGANEPTIMTVAGGGENAGDGLPATSVQLAHPIAVAVDAAQNLYIAEGTWMTAPCKVKKVSASGVMTMFAGDGSSDTDGENVPATSVSVCPASLAVDESGSVYIGERGRIRKVSGTGNITTIAGTGTVGFSGDGGPATQAELGFVHDVELDAQGNIYFVDKQNVRVRKINVDGVIETVAGNGDYHSSGDGGLATAAGMAPVEIAIDPMGRLLLVDYSNFTVRRVDVDGTISTVAGGGPFHSDPAAINFDLREVTGLDTDPWGNMYLTGLFNVVHMITPEGVIKVVAGSTDRWQNRASAGFSGDGGPASGASIDEPMGIAVDDAGNVFIADTGNGRIRKITPVHAPPVPPGMNAFSSKVRYDVGADAVHVVAGDFNADGLEDVALVSEGDRFADTPVPEKLHVLHQRTEGGLAPPIDMPFSTWGHTGPMLAVDLNHDRCSDLIFGTHTGVNVYLCEPGGFRAANTWPGESGVGVVSEMIQGDVDLDGYVDIVAKTNSFSWMKGLTIFYGDGHGSIKRRTYMPLDNVETGPLTWGDVNFDERADLIMVWRGANTSGVAVMKNDGVGGLLMPAISTTGLPGYFNQDIVAGDFDGDRVLDVLVSDDKLDGGIAHFRQTSQGDVAFRSALASYDYPGTLVARDMNGDGRDDLLIHHAGTSGIAYQQQPSLQPGGWLHAPVKFPVASKSDSLATGDFNADGCLDVALNDGSTGLDVLYGGSCVYARNGAPPALPTSVPHGSDGRPTVHRGGSPLAPSIAGHGATPSRHGVGQAGASESTLLHPGIDLRFFVLLYFALMLVLLGPLAFPFLYLGLA